MTWRSRPRRFVQYNDLVFDGTESINSAPSESISTKYSSTEYLLKHGSYVSTQSQQVLLKDDKITIDLAISTIDWDMDIVQAHVDFIKEQLVTRGKLWAIDTGGILIWAEVILDSYTPTYEWSIRDDGYIVFSVEFTNPSCTWKKADGHTTWFMPYELCSYTAMLANCFKNADCDSCTNPAENLQGFCSSCDALCCDLDDAVSLCEMRGDIEKDFFEKCNSKWRIVHNCQLGRDAFGDEKLWGQAFCDVCIDGTFVQRFYADTAIESKNVTVTLQGKFKDPEIFINGDSVILEGEYDGFIQISSKGQVTYFSDMEMPECQERNRVSNSKLTLCTKRWWRVHRGDNEIFVRGVKSKNMCVFVNYERLTY